MKHPMGMYIVSMTEMWERFSFYAFVSILVLFMMEVLHFSTEFSTFLYGIILASTYLFQLVAGYLTDKYISNRKSVIIGGVFMIISQLIFTYAASLYILLERVPTHSTFLFNYPEIIFLVGVVFMTLGSGFFKVSITSFVGLFYKGREELLDSAYTIFYMFINLGGFLAPFILNFIVGSKNPGLYQYGFLLGGIVVFAGLIMFIALRKYLCLPNGEPVGTIPVSKNKEFLESKTVKNNNESKLSKIEISRIFVIFLVLIVIIIYYMSLEQINTSFIIFNLGFVDRVIPFINITVSPELFISIPPLLVIIFGPIMIKVFDMLSKRNKEPSTVSKFGIGLLISAIAFVMLVIPLYFYDPVNRINMGWLVLFSIFIVLGELFIMPISLSFISKLAPARYSSLIMGVMFSATAVSEILAGLFAAATPTTLTEVKMLFNVIPVHGIMSFMWIFVIILAVSGTLWMLFSGKIKKLAHGID